MKACNDRIVVQKGIIPERTVGGIVLTADTSTDAKVKLNVGKVLSVGPGIRFSNGDFVSTNAKEGDVIMWEQFGDIAAEVLGERIVVVRFEDVTCVLDDPKEYEGWYFDMNAYREYEEKLRAEVEKNKVVEVVKAREVFACVNKDCVYVTKPVPVLQCEHCGKPTEEVADRVAPSIFVRDGASKPRV